MANTDLRDPDALQRDIRERREDLIQATSELRDIALETVDYRHQAGQLILRGAERTRVAFARFGEAIHRHPFRTALLLTGMGAFVLVLSAARAGKSRRARSPLLRSVTAIVLRPMKRKPGASFRVQVSPER